MKTSLAEFPSVSTVHTVYESCHRLIGRSSLELSICALFALALSRGSYYFIGHVNFCPHFNKRNPFKKLSSIKIFSNRIDVSILQSRRYFFKYLPVMMSQMRYAHRTILSCLRAFILSLNSHTLP